MSQQLLLSTLVIELHKVYCERRKVKRLPEGQQVEAYLLLQQQVNDLCRSYWGDLPPHPLEGKVHFTLGHNHVGTPCLEGERFCYVTELMNIPQQIRFLQAIEGLRLKSIWDVDEWRKTDAKEWMLINGKEPCYTRTAFTLTADRRLFECWHTIPRRKLHDLCDGMGGSWWWVSCEKPSIVQLFVDALVPAGHQMFKNEGGDTYWLP